MIRGQYSPQSRRPEIEAEFSFPAFPGIRFRESLIIDTGAHRTLLRPIRAQMLERDLGVPLSTLRRGGETTGVGGSWPTRVIDATLHFGDAQLPLLLTIMEPQGRISLLPSLLGRDILRHFVLVMNPAEDAIWRLDQLP